MPLAVNILSKDRILAALARLDRALAAREVAGEVCLFGGAAMVLAFDARESTRDIDAVFAPKQDMLAAIAQVSEELELDPDWLNDGVKGFVSPKGEMTVEDMPVFDHLRVLRPTTEYLLAMKCMASRAPGYHTGGDRADVVTLCRAVGVGDAQDVFDLIAEFYPNRAVPVRTQYFVEDVMAELGGGA